MSQILISLIPTAAVVVTLLILFLAILGWQRLEARTSRESPLVHDLLRPPGYSLRCKMDDLGADLDACFVCVVYAPLAILCYHFGETAYGGSPESFFRIVRSVTLALIFEAILGYRIVSLLRKRRHFRLGLEGELAVGEELNQLMLDGCRVYHDIPFPYGNIDHVVVSISGVYTVNTKMRQKSKHLDRRADVVVDHREGRLKFVDGVMPIPTAELETEARWLSIKLTSSAGRRVEAEPMLALPGWYIEERIGRGAVYVINPSKPKRFFVQEKRRCLDSDAIQQIGHQLEQLCRDVKPSFKERQRWEADLANR